MKRRTDRTTPFRRALVLSMDLKLPFLLALPA
jgi:hypothetical protein